MANRDRWDRRVLSTSGLRFLRNADQPARKIRFCTGDPRLYFQCTCHLSGRISDLLKFLIPKVGESFVLDHNVESQEVAQARPRPELAGALETILELAAL